jgi:beta-lactamase class A
MSEKKVFNLRTNEERTYAGITAKQAVIAAYAQEHNDNNNTWDYENRYAHLIERGKLTVACGDWCCKL